MVDLQGVPNNKSLPNIISNTYYVVLKHANKIRFFFRQMKESNKHNKSVTWY